jgi:hypothetical protein
MPAVVGNLIAIGCYVAAGIIGIVLIARAFRRWRVRGRAGAGTS